MGLTLRAVSLRGDPLIQPITVHFDGSGGSIGRADHNTMALPDPNRHISRRQAEVKALDGVFSLTNVGSANPIVVGSVTLARGESASLAHGDQIRIGGYLLEVEAVAVARPRSEGVGPAAVPVDVVVEPSGLSGSQETANDSLLGPFGAGGEVPLSAANPFADLLGQGTPPPWPLGERPAAAAVRPAAPARASGTAADRWPENALTAIVPPIAAVRGNPPATAPTRTAHAAPAPDESSAPPVWPRLPDDFDPFASPPATAFAAPAAPAADPVDAFADLIPSAESVSIDRAFGLDAGTGPDPLERFMAADAVSSPGITREVSGAPPSAALSADPLVLFGAPGDRPPAEPAPAPATASDHAPEWRTAFSPPRTLRAAESPPASPQPSSPAAAPATPRADEVSPAAWAAFCDGVGVRVDRPDGVDPETMRQIGLLLRTAVDGILRLMAVRASAKHELRAAVTVIQSQRNNPLKFSPDASAALEQLLQPPVRGFLPGPAAVEDAMDDLVGHAIGSIAGTRAALEGVLERFAPRQLEAKLAGRSMLDSVLPMTRRSRLWELYLQHFETIRSEAQDDFHSLFGRAFLAAYEKQLEGLRGDDAAARPPAQPSCG